MSQITIMDHVIYKDGSTLPTSATLNADGCCIEWADSKTSITWEQMSDVEFLSDKFADIPVRVFKVIVGMLGKISNYKEVYMATLEQEQ